MIVTILFWLIIFLVLHTYLFYPLILLLLARRKTPESGPSSPSFPSISVVVSIYNESKILPQKLLNLQSIDYPASKIEVLFGSDGSTDSSVQLLQDSCREGFKILNFNERRGKAAVLNDLIAAGSGDVIVFTDANTEFAPQTVKMLLQHFDDPSVGVVSGHLILRSGKNQPKTGEYSYWAFENKLKRMESKTGSLLGATGGVYAIRKDLFTPLPTDISITDDFLIPLKILMRGYRTVFEPDAIAYEELENSVAGEYRRKVRIGAQNLNVLPYISSLLRPRYGFIAFTLWSHKILRWLVPFFLLAITALLPILQGTSPIYGILLAVLVAFWSLGLIGYIANVFKIPVGYFGYPFYFLAMNCALFVGFFKAVLGLQKPTWNVAR